MNWFLVFQIVLLAVVAMAASQGVQVVDRNPYEVQVVDRNPLEVQVVDRNPLEVHVVENNPHVQVVDQPSPDAGNYNPDTFIVDEYFGKPGQVQNFQPIHTGPHIVNPPNNGPKRFPPGARGGSKY